MNACGAHVSYHRRFLQLVDHIERTFPVGGWRCGDVPIWPLARMELYLDMHFASIGVARPTPRRFPARSLARAALPLRNLWRSRRDIKHLILAPHSADAIVFGDGVTLDWVDGTWRDRYGEPIIAALEERGLQTFLMQSGDLRRLPWQRATYPANIIATHGAQLAASARQQSELHAHREVLEFLARQGVSAPGLERAALQRRSGFVAMSALCFERLLEAVNPRVAFLVNYYSGLGPAFVMACRRRGILSVDLQHCPQDGAHQAYSFCTVPREGYAVLPDIFWNWTARDADHIRGWARQAEGGRHQAIHGGHTQLAAFLDERGAWIRSWDEKFAAVAGHGKFDKEILVALQPLGGHRAEWDALRDSVASAPRRWRWWIRRHPATGPGQDAEYAALLRLEADNIVLDGASMLPLPALLRHMDALVSLASGAAAEAAALGVPGFFLSETARERFFELIDCGASRVVEVEALNEALAAAAPAQRDAPARAPALSATLQRILQEAQERTAPRATVRCA
jgi:hypothetical protein